MLKQLLSVFLQSHCAFCQRTTPNPCCEYCCNQLSFHQFSKSDRHKLYQSQSAYAWGRYEGQLKRAIALMKYNNKPEIGSVLGELIGRAWLASKLSEKRLTVVPIPMHYEKQKARGFNQAEVMAKSFCRITGYKLNTRALIRNRATEAMFNLPSTTARAKNLEGALEVGTKIPRHPVLLLDDIHTTGTTVDEATKILKQNQIKVIGVVVAAKAGMFLPGD